jgi:glycosyltransferase involved in cell wall biosynthesis
VRILHVCPALDPAWAYGRTPQRVARLARAQAALGHEVGILTTDALAPHERLPTGRSQVDGVSVSRVRNLSGAVRTWLHLSTPLRFSARLRSILRETPPDIVHGHELRTIENLIAARVMPATVPFVVSLHETTRWTGHEWIQQWWDAQVGGRVLARIDAALTASPSEGVAFLALCDARRRPLRDDQLTVVRHGVDRVLGSMHADRSEARRRFSLDEGPVALFVDRSAERQDVDLLLSAFLDGAAMVPKAQLLVVGSDRGRIGAARMRLAGHAMAGLVRFAGHLTAGDREAAFACADLFALPFVDEASLTAGAEILAAGLPVIVDRRAGLDAVTVHGSGWTVDGPRAWAEALRVALSDRAALAAVRERAETLARTFAWTAVAADVSRVYERVCAGVVKW